MVVYRESVCREIVGWLAAHGHRIPRLEGVDALKVSCHRPCLDFSDLTAFTENVVSSRRSCQRAAHSLDTQHYLLHQGDARRVATLFHQTRHALLQSSTLLWR